MTTWKAAQIPAAYAVKDSKGRNICIINTAVADQASKALLFAAAPDLLEALECLMDPAQEAIMSRIACEKCGDEDDGGLIAKWSFCVDKGRAALAKARGEQA